ncbi:MAG: hypothetical protein IT371_20410 [Deltaproteobacteria bacterium]|nr:hypothetical protein [Deltaproteobacteria bacterium]
MAARAALCVTLVLLVGGCSDSGARLPDGAVAPDAGPSTDAAGTADTGPARDLGPSPDQGSARDAAASKDTAPATDGAPPAADGAPPVSCTPPEVKCSPDGKKLLSCRSDGSAYDEAACEDGCDATAKPAVCKATDLSGWQIVQFPLTDSSQAPASYTFASQGLKATQTVNADPSVLLHNKVFGAVTVRGRFTVASTVTDDDLIGFVFGWQDASHFYLFDWKGATQSNGTCGVATAGMTVKVMSQATKSTLCKDFWPSAGSAGMKVLSPVSANLGGWVKGKPYDFELVFGGGKFTITVRDGTTVKATISVTDSTFTSGKFGFYNYSQNAVTYESFQFSTP